MLHGGANFLPAPRPAQVGVALSKPSTPGARGVDSAVLKGEQQRFEGKLGVKPPTTDPSPGAAPPTARVQTQMQTPTQGALGPPSAKPGAPDPFAAHDAANKAKMLSPASAPGGSGWAPPSSTTKPSAAAPAPAAPEPGTPAAKGGTPWNKILAVGGALGAGALGLKGVGMGLNFLGSRGASPPADYGYAPGGYQVPMGVNGYGAPQPGSRMM